MNTPEPTQSSDTMNQSIDPPHHVFFSDVTVEHEAGYTFDDYDVEIMFYTNADVTIILKECKKEGDLPLFWTPLRISRVRLLWNQMEQAQDYIRNKLTKERAAKRDLLEDLAGISRKVTQYQQTVAFQEAKKLETEVQRLMVSTTHEGFQRELLASNIDKSLSQKDLSLSPRSNRLQSISRNSIAARPA